MRISNDRCESIHGVIHNEIVNVRLKHRDGRIDDIDAELTLLADRLFRQVLLVLGAKP